MGSPYDDRYEQQDYYWGKKPTTTSLELLKHVTHGSGLKLLDIGCGEGRNAVFFARNGFDVHAFDLSSAGVEKTKALAEEVGVAIRVFQADLLDYELEEEYDVLFSTGVLHLVPPATRNELFECYRTMTTPNGLNVFSVFVQKPFIPEAPDADPNAHPFKSGELFTHFNDWRIEWCNEEIFDCMSSGVPHQHAVNRVVARKELTKAADAD